MTYHFDFSSILDYLPVLFKGVLVTIELIAVGAVFGVALGIACAWAKALGPAWLRPVVSAYVELIRNTPREPELVRQLEDVFADPRFEMTRAVVVRDHGAYIWGDDVLAAKRHTEVYHFLFEAVVARRDRAQEPSR